MTMIYQIGYKGIETKIKQYQNSQGIQNILSIIVFTTENIQIFYQSFEIVQIPMQIQIGYQGTRNRKITAGMSLFMYTVIGSQFFLIGMIYIISSTGSQEYKIIMNTTRPVYIEYMLWISLVQGFIVKIPQIPVHIWLPEAHVEAPTTGSVILAAILLKYGAYGQIKWSIPLFPIASKDQGGIIITLGIISAIYSSQISLVISDQKKIIAYSSIGHMGVATIGLLSGIYGEVGGIHFQISHGVISAGLFIMIGIIYERYHTRTILYYRGQIAIYPIMSVTFQILMLGNISFPQTSSFISELIILQGLIEVSPLQAGITSITILQVPSYCLWLYHRMFYGTVSRYIPVIYTDLTIKEYQVVMALILAMMYLGMAPSTLLRDVLPI